MQNEADQIKAFRMRLFFWMLAGVVLIGVGAVCGDFTDAFFLYLIGGGLMLTNYIRLCYDWRKREANVDNRWRIIDYTDPTANSICRAGIKQYRRQYRLAILFQTICIMSFGSAFVGYLALAAQLSNEFPHWQSAALLMGFIAIVLLLVTLIVIADKHGRTASDRFTHCLEALRSAEAYAARMQELDRFTDYMIDVRYVNNYTCRLIMLIDPFDEAKNLMSHLEYIDDFIFCMYLIQYFNTDKRTWNSYHIYSFNTLEEMLADVAVKYGGIFDD